MPEVMTIGEPMVNLIADSTETYLEARQLPRQMAGLYSVIWSRGGGPD